MTKINFDKKILIGEKYIGQFQPAFIIAEAGVSHFGDVEKCFKLVDLAVKASADAIKFQLFDINSFISRESKEWFDRMKNRSLDINEYKKVQQYCKKKKIIFFLTPHDFPSFQNVMKINTPVIKIGSGEVKNHSFVKKILKSDKPVFYSTGMHTKNDVNEIVKICKKIKKKNIVFMQCTSSYPTKNKNVNLNVIDYYKKKIGSIIGYSDHTKGIDASLLAVAKGAKVIEKHISLDFNLKNAQDWRVSCGPDDLKKFVSRIREVEDILGEEEKKITSEEKNSIKWARKSLILKRSLEKGDIISEDDITLKRPGIGISPEKINLVIGKKIKRKVKKDTILKLNMFN